MPFDRKACLLTRKVTQHKGTFYTSLCGEYHIIRESIFYALGLMQENPAANCGTVEQILRTVCALQDQEPASPTFGVWPLYMEEPLDQQPRPDWNWADFCGRGLLQFLIGYAAWLSEDTVACVKAAVHHAAYRIMRRNVSPAYTNISCMGTYTALAAGEYLPDAELAAYARERFRKLYSYNTFHQCVSEYNSSTYTIESLVDLSLIAKDIHDPAVREQARLLLDMQWGYTLEHFCADNGQWTGPQSRCYETIQGARLLSFLQVGADGRAQLISPEKMELEPMWLQAGLHIPDRWIGMLNARDSHFFHRHPVLLDKPEIYASQFRRGSQSLGSFSFCDFWTQRRPVIAYFGNDSAPCYLRLRCMHDDFDFTSGLMACSQNKNVLVCGMSLCNDHGDRHFTMDPIEGEQITAGYLAFRFEFGGDQRVLRGLRIEERERGYLIAGDDTVFAVYLGRNGYQGRPLAFRWGADAETRYLDLIMYDGPEKHISLSRGTEAYASAVLGMFRPGDPAAEEMFSAVYEDSARIWMEDGYAGYGVSYAERIHTYKTQVPLLQETRECHVTPARHVWRVTAKCGMGEE